MTGPTPAQLAAGARKALQPSASWGGAWPRAAALLARQALEEAVAVVWYGPLLPMRQANMAAQLISLPFFMDDPDLGHRARQCWHTLSNVVHAHPYELAPTVSELIGWLGVVEELVTAVSSFGSHGGRSRIDTSEPVV